MFTGPVGPVEVFFYWPGAVFENFYWPGAIGSPSASSPAVGDLDDLLTQLTQDWLGEDHMVHFTSCLLIFTSLLSSPVLLTCPAH